VANGGFDTGMSSWNSNGASWYNGNSDPTNDRNGCGDSGSAGGTLLNSAPIQCVQNVVGNRIYYFGVSIWVNASYDPSFCEMTYHGVEDCSDEPLNSTAYDIGPGITSLAPGWNDYHVYAQAPFDAVAAYIWCASEDSLAKFDQFYLNTTTSY
jgi:hypothetical protein